MSSASFVPETRHRADDGAWETARGVGFRALLVGAGQRLRVSDGFSHARSLAWVTSLIAVQGLIALVGLASALGGGGIGRSASRIVQATAPGPVGDALLTAVEQARAAGEGRRLVALGFGLAGSLITATTGMGQLQRSLNRLYGIERDRPTLAKYGRAALLGVSAGTLITIASLLLATGSGLSKTMEDNRLTPVWGVVRVPLAASLLVAAIAVLFRWCPNRRQPGWSWLALGAAVSVTLWVLVTVLLGLVFRYSSTFGRAYGPLAGVVALLLWALLSSIALLFGAAVAAQLEAERAARATGEPPPPGPTQMASTPAPTAAGVAARANANGR